MQRRQVLASVAALLPLAGCLGQDDGDPDDRTTTETTTTTERPPNGPRYEGATLEMTNAECATEDATAASVAFGKSEVEITGTIVGADACHVAKLDVVVYDEQARELTVVVETERQADGDTVCAQCLTAIEYAVTARFRDGLPDRVIVSHRQNGTVEQVTVAERS
ncbi:MAG: hypothetical protein ABEJ44_02775 [Halanaeroarchaeum sp.]